MVKTLIENGADTQHASDSGHTALNQSAKGGYYKVVSLLLEHGVDPYNRIKGKLVGKKALSTANRHQPGFLHSRPLPSQNYKLTKDVLTQAMNAGGNGEVRSLRSHSKHTQSDLSKRITNFIKGGSRDERQPLIDSMAGLSVYGK